MRRAASGVCCARDDPMNPDAYHAFTQALTAKLQADDRVRGLVLLGSTAATDRQPDRWSDHDFFVITEPGDQEDFRARFDWLPDPVHIVLTVRETAHGLKVLYADGHLIEYAVFDVTEIAVARANVYSVVFDRGGVADAMRQIATSEPVKIQDPQNTMSLFLCLLVVGAGRVARGEAISGGSFIRTHALGHLLTLLATSLDAPDKAALDNLDPFRRFEQVFPAVGAEINAALLHPPIEAASALLNVFERALSHTPGYPADAVTTVRELLTRADNT
ncbi:MAG: hypothetical protein AAF125_07950 [Chloroflexota bacterium]